MGSLAPHQDIEPTFAGLLDSLQDSWSVEDIAYMRDLVFHGEYGEALENLVALAARNRAALTPQQIWSVERLSRYMGVSSPLLSLTGDGLLVPTSLESDS